MVRWADEAWEADIHITALLALAAFRHTDAGGRLAVPAGSAKNADLLRVRSRADTRLAADGLAVWTTSARLTYWVVDWHSVIPTFECSAGRNATVPCCAHLITTSMSIKIRSLLLFQWIAGHAQGGASLQAAHVVIANVVGADDGRHGRARRPIVLTGEVSAGANAAVGDTTAARRALHNLICWLL